MFVEKLKPEKYLRWKKEPEKRISKIWEKYERKTKKMINYVILKSASYLSSTKINENEHIIVILGTGRLRIYDHEPRRGGGERDRYKAREWS